MAKHVVATSAISGPTAAISASGSAFVACASPRFATTRGAVADAELLRRMRGIRGRGREVSRQAEVARGCPPALQTIDDASCALEGGDERGRRASYDRGAPERGGRGLVEAGRADRLGGAARRRTARGMTRQRSIGASERARIDRGATSRAWFIHLDPGTPRNARRRARARTRRVRRRGRRRARCDRFARVRAASIASRRATGDGRRRRDRRRSVRASRPRSVPRAGRDSASDLFPVARCRKTTRARRAARNAPAGDAGASDDGRERRGGHGEGSHFDV